MPLSEPQIARYARHILLPEVGGVGQERLLAAEVSISGASTLVELAGDYLSAAGVRVDAHSGPGLTLRIHEGPAIALATDAHGIRVTSSSCSACCNAGAGGFETVSGAIAASLAASEALRLILGLGSVERSWRVRADGTVEAIPFEPCAEHGAAR